MGRAVISKSVHAKVHADSGYLSDKSAATGMSKRVTAALSSSSPPGRNTRFALERTEPQSVDVDTEGYCDLMAQIKTPTRFPIRPLKETLARAKADATQQRNYGLWSSIDRECVTNNRRLFDGAAASDPFILGESDSPTRHVQDSLTLHERLVYEKSDQLDAALQSKRLFTKAVNATTVPGQAKTVSKGMTKLLQQGRNEKCSQNKRKLASPSHVSGQGGLALIKPQLRVAVVDGFGRTRAASKRMQE
ncbi:hypothetical protein ACEQ8H_006338 [Pleosporales sp. CAS-2024a]